jgi:hypothetical protein
MDYHVSTGADLPDQLGPQFGPAIQKPVISCFSISDRQVVPSQAKRTTLPKQIRNRQLFKLQRL